MNIDILNNNLDSSNYFDLINEYGFISLINYITRRNERGESRLDHVFMKSKSLCNVKYTLYIHFI